MVAKGNDSPRENKADDRHIWVTASFEEVTYRGHFTKAGMKASCLCTRSKALNGRLRIFL